MENNRPYWSLKNPKIKISALIAKKIERFSAKIIEFSNIVNIKTFKYEQSKISKNKRCNWRTRYKGILTWREE